VEKLAAEVEGVKDSEEVLSAREKVEALSLAQAEERPVADDAGSSDAPREGLAVFLALACGTWPAMGRISAVFGPGRVVCAVASVGEASVSARLRFLDLASVSVVTDKVGSFCNRSMMCCPESHF